MLHVLLYQYMNNREEYTVHVTRLCSTTILSSTTSSTVSDDSLATWGGEVHVLLLVRTSAYGPSTLVYYES